MDALSAAAALLPDLRVEAAETLRRSERSEVLRVRVDGPGWPGPPTLIVKLYPDAGESWARETAALTAMPGTAPVPRLIAASADPPALVMTDADTGLGAGLLVLVPGPCPRRGPAVRQRDRRDRRAPGAPCGHRPPAGGRPAHRRPARTGRTGRTAPHHADPPLGRRATLRPAPAFRPR